MKIGVIGTGYVGLVAGACFADTGNQVFCVDNDEGKIKRLKAGEIPIYEPGLESIVRRAHGQGRLHFTTEAVEGIAGADIIFLAVGTPALPNGEPNLQYLQAAAETIGREMTGPTLIINKSTVPIGSHQVVGDWIRPHTSHDFDVASNPEFLKEGSAVEDFLRPDRVVIGSDKESVFKKLENLYAPFVRQGNPIIRMDPVSAELTKYACNSFLAARISYMNELSNLCEKVGADIEVVRNGMSTDSRIGKHFLYAGVGYGGSCFPKDIESLLTTARKHKVKLGVVESAQEANARQKKHLLNRIAEVHGTQLSGKKFAIWGLAFKPNTDDMRDAPALEIITELHNRGAEVCAFDPVAGPKAIGLLGDVLTLVDSAYEAVTGADALCVITEWNEFRHPDFARVKKLMRTPTIFDGRNLYDSEALKVQGFQYLGIGRQ